MDPSLDSSSATAAALCQSLVRLLQARPALDEDAQKYLLEAMTEIQNCLAYKPTPLPSLPNIPDILRKKSSMISGSSSKETARRSLFLGTTTVRVTPDPASGPTAEETTLSTAQESVQAAEEELEEQSSASRHLQRQEETKKKKKKTRIARAIIATKPCIKLSERDSTVTVMEGLLGRQFFERWRSWRRVILVVLGPAELASLVLFWTTALAEERDTALISGLLFFFPLAVIAILQLTAVSTFSLFRMSLWTFEAKLFLLEGVLFTLSLAGVFNFSPPGCLLGAQTLWTMGWTFFLYDAIPKKVRDKIKYAFLFNGASLAALLVLIYFRLPPRMGLYRFDPQRWELIEDTDCDKERTSKWSISLLDVCLNRGATVLFTWTRATYLAFRHPEDCIFIRSRVRVLELEEQREKKRVKGEAAVVVEGDHSSKEKA